MYWRGVVGHGRSRAPFERLSVALRSTITCVLSARSKRGDGPRTLLRRCALGVAVTAGRERCVCSGERSSIGKKDVPAIRQHQDIAPHLTEEDLAQRDAVTVVPPIAVKHEHRRPR